MPYDDDWYACTASKGPVKRFDIVTDQDAIVLRGARDEATDQVLTGKVVLDLKSTISGKVKLRFSRRIRHTQRIYAAGDLSGTPGQVDLVYHEEDLWDQYLVPEQTKLAPGEHVWNFSIPIVAETAASLEGPPTTYVVYRLKCVVERGVLTRDLTQKKHVRIHRTFNPDSLALQQTMTTESHWEGKCSYLIETPTKGIIYGTHVPMVYKLAPLAKGIRPCRVKCTITQVTRFHQAKYTRVPFNTKDQERDISESHLELPENSLEQDTESFYTIKQTIPLPKELTKACQTYKEHLVQDIEIRHYVNYKVGIWNPDGHISEIQGRLPIHIFFTQSMHVEGNSVSGLPESSNAMQEALHDVPPDYNHIHLDALYDIISMSGYATPALQSGAMTPRNASISNMGPLAEDDEGDDYEAHANALRNRLDNEINPFSAPTTPTNEPNANALRNRLEQINLATNSNGPASNYKRHSGGAIGRSGSRSGNRSPVAIVRNRSFNGPMAHSPLATSNMTPSQEQEDPLLSLQRPEPVRSHTTPSLTVDSSNAQDVDQPHSSSPDHSGSATPGGISSALPTRPSSPVHMEDLNRVPSYNTAKMAPAVTGPYGSQHGGVGLPTYQDIEEESASRSGSIAGSGTGSGAATPATAASLGAANGVGSLGATAPENSERPRTLVETGRTRSGIFGSFLHHKHK